MLQTIDPGEKEKQQIERVAQRGSLSMLLFLFKIDSSERKDETMLLESDHFLLELTKLFQQQRLKNVGSLSLTMKRFDGRAKPTAKLTKKQRLEQKKTGATSTSPPSTPTTAHETIEYKCLVRANYGSKKLSTVVSAKDINRFQLVYANLLKANMDTLKKKAKENKSAGQASAHAAAAAAASQVPSSPTATAAASTSASNPPKKSAASTTSQASSSSPKLASPSVANPTKKASTTPSKKK